MKHIFYLLLTTIILQGELLAQNSTLDLTDGLVAYYPFDGNANDASGNGNHGTVHGATLAEDRFGSADSAYSFDGLDDYIEFPYGILYNLKKGTVAICLKITSLSGPIINGYTFRYIIGVSQELAFGLMAEGVFGLRTTENGGGWWSIRNWHNSEYGPASYPPSNTFQEEQWMHIVITWDGNLHKLYVDGKKVESISSALGTFNHTSPILLGVGWDGNSFHGIIDNLRTYNRALSDSEIQALYTNADFTADKTSGAPPLTVQFTDASTLEEPITSWAWDFENDGTIDSTEQNPTYTYNEKGIYSVNLTVGDGTNEFTTTKKDFILVYDALLALNTPVQNTLTVDI